MIGAGGYAELYAEHLLEDTFEEYLNFTAIVDPYAKKSSLYDKFKDKFPVYDHMEDCYKKHETDFTIIATPINLHFKQCITALDHGSHIYCEKPLVPSVAQLDSLDKKCKDAGKTMSVGFQQCYSNVIRGIKERILANEFGKPVRLKTFISWPRPWKYYQRAAWIGRLETPDGELTRDSVISNATSHYIQNILYLLGSEMDEAVELTNTAVECYKVNDIETFDTIILRGEASEAEVYFSASHAVNVNKRPIIIYEFEKACITANVFDQEDQIQIQHKNGIIESPGSIYGDATRNRPLYTAQSILGERDFDCPGKTVRPFTKLIDEIFTQTEFNKFPDEFIIKDTQVKQTYVKSLYHDLQKCFDKWKLPSEIGLSWARNAVQIIKCCANK